MEAWSGSQRRFGANNRLLSWGRSGM